MSKPGRPRRGPNPRHPLGQEDRRLLEILRGRASSSDDGRARVGYALLGMAFLTSPLMLPFALALLMAALGGTPLGPALLQNLHLVYIGSVAYCFAALAGAACLLRRPASAEASEPTPLALPGGPARLPDARHLEFQRWLLAHGRYARDVPAGAASRA